MALKMREGEMSGQVVQVEIGLDKLASLFRQGVLCATEVRCLNDHSKESVWQLCLNNCLQHCCLSGVAVDNCALDDPGEVRPLFLAGHMGRPK
jgi:hypothetical protein